MVISVESMNYSLKNLYKRKTRSLLTIFSIFIGITTIFIFISFGLGLYNYIEGFSSSTAADKITIQPKGIGAPGLDDTFYLTEQDLKAIEKVPGVYEATGLYFKAVEVEKSNLKKYVYISAFDPKKPLFTEISDLKIFKGRELQQGDKSVVVLGYNYQLENKIFPRALDLNERIDINGESYRIVGFYDSLGNPQDDSNIYITQEQFLDSFNETKGYGWIVARVDITEMQKIISDAENAVRKSRNLDKGKEDFYVASFEDLVESFTTSLYVVIFFVIIIALVSVFVSAINTANTMITSVIERYKEIGVIKAIGAKNSEIFKIFLFESGFLGFVAGCLGVLLGWIISSAAGSLLNELGWGFLQPYVSTWLIVSCIVFATVTGALSGVIPAYYASKTNIVDSLRYE